MGGKETIDGLRQIDAKVKAIVSTGYSNDPIMSDYKKHGFSGVVAKPFNLRSLGNTLAELLAKDQDIT
jgi:CheY-like chemotaxis protein